MFKDDFHLMFSHINELIKHNCVKPVVGKTYPLEETIKAHNDVINKTGTTGRLTLIIP